MTVSSQVQSVGVVVKHISAFRGIFPNSLFNGYNFVQVKISIFFNNFLRVVDCLYHVSHKLRLEKNPMTD